MSEAFKTPCEVGQVFLLDEGPDHKATPQSPRRRLIMLCRVDSHQIGLIALNSGNRWSNPIKYPFTQIRGDTLESLFKSSYCAGRTFTRVTLDFQHTGEANASS